MYKDPYPQREIINKSFQTVFIKESSFPEVNETANGAALEEFKVEIGKERKIMESIGVQKFPQLGRLSNCMIKEYSELLADEIISLKHQ